MYLDWNSKPLAELFREERERVGHFIEAHVAEFSYCLIEHVLEPDTWNELRDFVATFGPQMASLWPRLPGPLRTELQTYLDQYQAEPTSLILGLKFGLLIVEKSEQQLNRQTEDQATAKLKEQLHLTTDEALGYAVAGSSSNELTVMLKVLPIARASILTSRVSEHQLNSTVALLDAPIEGIDAIVNLWVQRLKSADEIIGRSRRDYKRIAQRMLDAELPDAQGPLKLLQE